MAQILLDSDTLTNTAGTLLSAHSGNWVKTDAAQFEVNICSTGVGVNSAGGSGQWGSNYRTGQTWTNDQWAEMKCTTIPVPNGIAMVGVRIQAGAISGYFAGYSKFEDATHHAIYFLAATVRTVRAVGPVFASGDVVNLQADGLTLTMTINGGSPTTYDTTPNGTKYATGSPGLAVWPGDASADLGDTWRAGSVGAAAAPPDQFVTVQIRAA